MSDRPPEILGNFTDRITYGFTNPMPTTESGPFMITAKDINHGRILYEQARRTSKIDFDTLTDKSRPKIGDLLLTKDGTLGRMAIVDREGICVNQSVAVLTPNNRIKPLYLKYLLEAPQNFRRMINDADGSTIKHIYITRLAKLTVDVPSLIIQERIISMLGSIDHKIELNRQMNEKMELIAQEIFKDWFVDFGPVNRKKQGNTSPDKILGGLIPDPNRAAVIATIFPNSLDDDDLPEGWKRTTLEEYADLNPESWTKKNHPKSIRYLDLKNTKWGNIGEFSDYDWSDAPSRARRIVKPSDTIVGTVRPGNGSYCYISENGYTASTGFAVLRPKQNKFTNYIYICATRSENIKRLAHKADGAAYPAIRPNIVHETEALKFSIELMAEFESIISPIRSKIEQGKKENQILAETRDYLLPKLISGQVSIADIDEAA